MGHIEYLSKEQTLLFVKTDQDMYVARMTPADLSARSCKTHDEYKSKHQALNFSPAQKQLLAKAVKDVDSSMLKIGQLSSTVDLRSVSVMSWRFSLMDRRYENSWPHTRESIVFLSPDFFAPTYTHFNYLSKCETLAHEKIHVFQRAWPEACAIYHISQGFMRIGFRKQLSLVRANPDLDEYVYSQNCAPCFVSYKNNRPMSMDDVESHGPTEHPNEAMAYRVGKLVRDQLSISDDI